MNLQKVLQGIEYTVIKGNVEKEVHKIAYDSRKVEEKDLFFCIDGFTEDGHKFAEAAVKKGAAVIVCQREIAIEGECTIIQTSDTRKALALASANYYDHPAKKLKLIGITGTNGKTTSAFMIKSILEKAGYKVGLIGTIANYIGDKKITAHRTTPESLELHELFKDMIVQGADYCVMEVSSHSLSLDRVYGLSFSESIFTNLTQDHLDFHETFENYYGAKLKLFKNSEIAVINIDDSYGKRVYEDSDCIKITFGIEEPAKVKSSCIKIHSRGAKFQLETEQETLNIALPIPGKYNVYNALGSAVVCLREGVSLETIQKGLEDVVVPGRCELASKKYNLGFEIIIDYAHSPDGLKNILETAREFTTGSLISIFGCGGDRDKTKRRIMGKIGTDLSDYAILTSDNPRSEDPNEILKEVVQGVEKQNYEVVVNRKEAIKKAMQMAKEKDVIVIAGKGHEDYQVLKEETIHFDEREIIADIIKELF